MASNNGDKEPIQYEICDLLFRFSSPVTFQELGALYREARKQRGLKPKPITLANVYSLATKCREILELRKDCTLINIPNIGYRIIRSQTQEMAVFAAKNVRRVVMMADRANRLHPLINPDHIPEALHHVFMRGSSRIERLSGLKRHLLECWKKAFQRKEIENVN